MLRKVIEFAVFRSHWLMACCMLCATQLLPLIFNSTSRWILVVFVFIASLLGLKDGLGRVGRGVFSCSFAFCVWCLISSLWSDLPLLSLMKGSSFLLVICGLFFVGYKYASQLLNFSYFWRMILPFGVSGFAVALTGTPYLSSEGSLYSGSAGNSNFLGWIMATSAVGFLALSRALVGWRSWALLLLTVASLFFLLSSKARGSFILAIFGFCGIAFGYGPSRLLFLALFGAVSTFVIIAVFPERSEVFYEDFVIKNRAESLSHSWELSRAFVFDYSWRAALEGGWIGLGYGVSWGSDPSGWDLGLSTVGYSREKGNSFLAIVEEVGLIGLGLFMLVLLFVLKSVIVLLSLRMSLSHRILVFSSAAYVLGMLCFANFEAWLLAPGSSESIFFWWFLGCWVGLVDRSAVSCPC